MSPSATFQNGALTNGVSVTNGVHPAKKAHVHVDGFGTRAIHVGSEPNAETGAVIPPISLSTTYQQESIGVHKGFEYSRSGNPNRNLLESTLAALELPPSPLVRNTAIAFSSGSSTTSAVLSSLGPNAHIVSVNDVYGGTFRYISRVASTLQNLQSTFLDLENATDDELYAAIKENTKLIWIETPTNPTLRMVDVARVARVARSHPSRPIVLVDNTFLSPFYASPLAQGADVVLHSLTKYVNGHSDVVMGALILPDPTSYPASGELTPNHPELANTLRFLQNAMGAVPSPFDCFLAQRGAKTLALRMKAHGTNALAVARALQALADAGAGVEEVVYPGLPGRTPESRRRHAMAWQTLSPHARRWIAGGDAAVEGSAEPPVGGFPFSGMISVRLTASPARVALGTVPAASPTSGMATGYDTPEFGTADAFLKALRLFTLAESLGGVESLAEHPAAMTHGSIPAAEREKLGISEGLVRLSVGVEEEEDLVRDVVDAVRASFGVVEKKAPADACGRDGMCREFEY